MDELREKVDRLVDMLIEETLATPDDEILAQMTEEDFADVAKLRAKIKAAIAQHSRD